MNQQISLPDRSIPILCEAEVLVIGGGSAGVAAAVSAARQGASVVLAERGGFLGGAMTAATLGGICGLYSLVDGQPVQRVWGFAEEVRDRLERAGGTNGPLPWLNTASLPYDLFKLKSVLDDLVAEPRLKVLYHAQLIDVTTEDGRVREAVFRGRSEAFAIRADRFIDCTGDAELTALAGGGVSFDPDNLQFPSAMFTMGGVDTTRALQIRREDLHRYFESALADGYDVPRTAGGLYSIHDGIVHLNITKVSIDGRSPNTLDPVDLSKAEQLGRQQIRTYLDIFRKYVPGYEKAFVIDCGSELGVRETRRIQGEYRLTREDVLDERRFDDAIAVNCWPIEDHGSGRKTKWVWLTPGGYCQIPYRALLPQKLENVLVAGRCLSSSHDAQASLRVTANCFSMGQAAGIAAAMADREGMHAVDMSTLQHRLESQGQILTPDVTCDA